MNYKISFVIPCYNGEKYVSNLLSQLVSIDSDTFEIVIVNDGSKDNSLTVINQWASKYPFIKVINQSNQGASAARNNGVKNASGDYICFLDCDDAIVPENYYLMIKEISNDDLYLYNVSKNTDDTIFPFIVQKMEYTSKSSLISNNQFVNAPWGKVIKKSLFDEYHLMFNTDLKISEDLLWSVQLLHCAQSIKTLNIDFYIYKTDNVSSTTNSINNLKFDGLWEALSYSVSWCDNNNSSDACYSVCSYHYMINCAYCYSYFDKYCNEYKKYRYLLKYDLNKRVRLIRYLSKLFGLRFTSFLLNKYLMR